MRPISPCLSTVFRLPQRVRPQILLPRQNLPNVDLLELTLLGDRVKQIHQSIIVDADHVALNSNLLRRVERLVPSILIAPKEDEQRPHY